MRSTPPLVSEREIRHGWAQAARRSREPEIRESHANRFNSSPSYQYLWQAVHAVRISTGTSSGLSQQQVKHTGSLRYTAVKSCTQSGSVNEDRADGLHPKVVSHDLLEKMGIAEVQKAYFIVRQGKGDIPAYRGDGRIMGIDLANVVMEGSGGQPDRIDRANSFIKDKIVAVGFPDILFWPTDVFAKLLAQLDRSEGDVVPGCFPAHDTKAKDMIDRDARLQGRAI